MSIGSSPLSSIVAITREPMPVRRLKQQLAEARAEVKVQRERAERAEADARTAWARALKAEGRHG